MKFRRNSKWWLLPALFIFLISAAYSPHLFNQDKASAAYASNDYDVNGWEQVLAWPRDNVFGSEDSMPTPGYHAATNRIRFGNISVPYTQGYAYKLIVRDTWNTDREVHNNLQSIAYGGLYGEDVSGYFPRQIDYVSRSFNPSDTYYLYRQPYDSSYRVYNSYTIDKWNGTGLFGFLNGNGEYESGLWWYYGQPFANIDAKNRTYQLYGDPVPLGPDHRVVYQPNYDGYPLVKFEYVDGSPDGRAWVNVTTYQIREGSLLSKKDFVGKLIGKVGAYDNGGPSGLNSNYVQRYTELTNEEPPVDRQPPDINISANTTNWTNGNVTLTINASDPSGIRDVTLPDGRVVGNGSSYEATGNGTFTFKARDNFGNESTSSYTVSNIDRDPPGLSLQSLNTSPVNTGVTIKATAWDNIGISRIALPDGNSVWSSETTYYVTENGNYTFASVDHAGNVHYETIGIWNIDKTPPVLTHLSIKSNASDPSYAKSSDRFTAILTFNEPMREGIGALRVNSGTSDGYLYKYGSSPNVYAFDGYFYGNTEDVFIDGFTTLRNVSDLAGNYLNLDNVKTSDGSGIHYYNKAPSVKIKDFTSSKGNPGYAIDGSIVRMYWESSQHLSSAPVVTLGGRNVTSTLVRNNRGGTSEWYSEVQVTTAFPQGSMSFSMNSVINKVGVQGSSYAWESPNMPPVVDTILPVVSDIHLSYEPSASNPSVGAYDYARVGDKLTVRFKAVDTNLFIQPSDRVTIQGTDYPFTNISSNIYGTTVVLKDVFSPDGKVDVKVKSVSDKAGNKSNVDLHGYDGSSVPFYPPTLLTDTSTDRVATKYPGQRSITVSVIAEHPINSPYDLSVTVGGVTKTKTVSTNPSKTTQTFTFDVVKDRIPVGDHNAKIVATSWLGERTLIESKQIHVKEMYVWGKYNVNPGPTRGSYIKDVVALEGTYPVNGIHTDGYWYVLKGVYVPEPDLTLDAQGKVYYSPNPGRNIISITGKVEDSTDEVVTVTATLAGVTKTVAVPDSTLGVPKPFVLTWDVTSPSIAEGTYQNIEVGAKNSSGEQKKVSGLIAVVDKTKPVMAPVTFVSNNADPTFGKQGDTMTLTYTTSEELISAPKTVIGGTLQPPYQKVGNLYRSSKILGRDDPDGEVAFSIEYEDLAGNKNVTTATSDGSSITYYPVSPRLGTVTMSSNLAVDPKRAKVANVVRLSVESSHEWKMQPVVTLANRPSTLTKTSAIVYAATTTMKSTDPEGKVPFKISGVVDAAGNIGRETTEVTEGGKVVFDNTAPAFSVVTIKPVNGGTTVSEGDKIKIIFVPNEPLRTLPEVTVFDNPADVSKGPNGEIIAEYTIKPSDPPGPIKFEAKPGYTDLADNGGARTDTTTDGSSVTFTPRGPVVSAVSIRSTGSNPQVAQPGDSIILTVTTPSNFGTNISATVGNSAAYVNRVSPTKLEISRKMWEGDIAGPVSFSVTNIQDSSGRKSPDVTSTTDGSSVSFVNVVGTVSNVKVTSSRPDTNSLKVGDTIIINFEVNKELLRDPIVRVGTGTAYQEARSGDSYTYKYVLKNTDFEGNIHLDISNLFDIAGNPIPSVSQDTGFSLDKTAPKATGLEVLGEFTNGSNISVSFSTTEPLASTPTVKIGTAEFDAVKGPGNTYSVETPYNSSWAGDTVKIVVGNLKDSSGNVGPDLVYTKVISNSSSAAEDIIITFSGAEDGQVYQGSVIPVFYASSRSSKQVDISSSTLNGKPWVSGKPVVSSGTHVLRVVATSSQGSVTQEISFRVQ